MSKKILIVDDSETILKVISVTMGSSDYDVVTCVDEKKMFKELENNIFDMLLVDFTISAEKSGYDLIETIKSKWPRTKIFVMLGAFDHCDCEELEKAGADEWITKPFDSERFLKKCSTMLNGGTTISEEINNDEDAVDNSWEVNASKIKSEKKSIVKQIDTIKVSSESKLSKEVEGWGIAVPPVIGGATPAVKDLEFPAIIEDESSLSPQQLENSPKPKKIITEKINPAQSKRADEDKTMTDFDATAAFTVPVELSSGLSVEEEIKLGSKDEDEDYVAAPVVSQESEVEKDSDRLSLMKLSSKLVSLDELVKEDKSLDDVGDVSGNGNITVCESNRTDSLAAALKDEIEEDSTPEEVWQADNVEEDSSDRRDDVQKEGHPGFRLIDRRATYQEQEEEIQRLTVALTPLVRAIVKDLCEKQVEKISWEVIPDLAENLIRRELQDVKNSVFKNSNL